MTEPKCSTEVLRRVKHSTSCRGAYGNRYSSHSSTVGHTPGVSPKKIIHIVISMLLVTALGACGQSLEEQLPTRHWTSISSTLDPRFNYVAFTKDKTVEIKSASKSRSGTWLITEDGDVEISMSGSFADQTINLKQQDDGSLKSVTPKLHIAAWDGVLDPLFVEAEKYLAKWDHFGSGRGPFRYFQLSEGGAAEVRIRDGFMDPIVNANWRMKSLELIEITLKPTMTTREATYEITVGDYLTVSVNEKPHNYTRVHES